MQIEYARKATPQEVSKFKKFFKDKNKKLEESSQKIISEMRDELIDAYNLFAYYIWEEQEEINSQYEKYKKAFENKKCVCGSDVKYINSHGFYGCTNYKSVGEHRNFIKDEKHPSKRVNQLLKHYPTSIIKRLNLTGKITAKYLFLFLESEGLEDLNLKYLNIPYLETINTYQIVSKNAFDFEKESYKKLINRFDKAQLQFPIIYKIKGEKENMCFIDILCSNDKEVVIYECKASEMSTDDKQIEKYLSLIKFIDKTDRKITAEYLFERE